MSINPTIEISVQMFEFQKRFWWMLSSLIQQKSWQNNPVPKINVKISMMSTKDRFTLLTQKMIRTFDRLIDISIKEYTDPDIFGNRGLTRSYDIQETRSEWLFFTDADMIFHPEFFSEISANYLDGWKGTGKIITSPRINVPTEASYELANGFDYDSFAPVPNAFDICWNLKGEYSCRGRAPGAGYFQLIEVKYLKDNNITYCDRKRDRNLFHQSGNKFISDKVFRRKLNGTIVMKKPKDELGSRDILKPLLHLNHWRKSNPEWIDEGR